MDKGPTIRIFKLKDAKEKKGLWLAHKLGDNPSVGSPRPGQLRIVWGGRRGETTKRRAAEEKRG